MTMNVYDYYRNKAALESVRREIRRSRPRFPRLRLNFSLRLGAPSAPLAGAVLGLILGLCLGLSTDSAPLVLLVGLGVLWGFMGGTFVNWARSRGRLVASALRGDPLGNDGLRQLMGTRR